MQKNIQVYPIKSGYSGHQPEFKKP